MNFTLVFCIVAAVTIVGASATEPVQRREKICEPGSVFMDDCNQCRCTKDGFDKSCTRIACLGDIIRRRRANSDYCVPGSSFKIDCNTCICPQSGIRSNAACTLKFCI